MVECFTIWGFWIAIVLLCFLLNWFVYILNTHLKESLKFKWHFPFDIFLRKYVKSKQSNSNNIKLKQNEIVFQKTSIDNYDLLLQKLSTTEIWEIQTVNSLKASSCQTLCCYVCSFVLNRRARDVSNGVFPKWIRNSGNLINDWSMNYVHFNVPVSNTCLAGLEHRWWRVPVMTNIFVTEIAEFKENI